MLKKRLDAGEQRMNFLRYIAKYFFKQTYLERATARVRVPMTFLPQVGRTYFLRESGQDKSIYVGYLTSVTHTLVLEEGHGVADTQLTFSHVISRDANLLPIVLGDAEDGTNTAALLDQREAELVAQIAKPPFPPRSPCEPEATAADATGQAQSPTPKSAATTAAPAVASLPNGPVVPAAQNPPSTAPTTQPVTTTPTPAVPLTPAPAPVAPTPAQTEAQTFAAQQAAMGTQYAQQQAAVRAQKAALAAKANAGAW